MKNNKKSNSSIIEFDNYLITKNFNTNFLFLLLNNFDNKKSKYTIRKNYKENYGTIYKCFPEPPEKLVNPLVEPYFIKVGLGEDDDFESYININRCGIANSNEEQEYNKKIDVEQKDIFNKINFKSYEDTEIIYKGNSDEWYKYLQLTYSLKIEEKDYLSYIEYQKEEYLALIKEKGYSYDKVSNIIKNFLEEKYIAKGIVMLMLDKQIIDNTDNIDNDLLIVILLMLSISKEINLKYEKHSFEIGLNYSSKGIHLNKGNGIVTYDGEEIGRINLETQQYKLFEYLYNNKGKKQNHEDILKGIGVYHTPKLKGNKISDIKRELPKKVRDFIKTSTGHYYIP